MSGGSEVLIPGSAVGLGPSAGPVLLHLVVGIRIAMGQLWYWSRAVTNHGNHGQCDYSHNSHCGHKNARITRRLMGDMGTITVTVAELHYTI